MSQKESDQIVERLVTKMVQAPTQHAKEREKALNKRIEAVFELESFQRMVESADASGKSAAFKDMHYSANFIKGSSMIQKSLQQSVKVPE